MKTLKEFDEGLETALAAFMNVQEKERTSFLSEVDFYEKTGFEGKLWDSYRGLPEIRLKDCKWSDFKKVHDLYPCTDQTEIGTAGSNDYPDVDYLMAVKTENHSRFNEDEVSIYWKSGKVGISMVFPVAVFRDFLYCGSRKVTDCEHHYYGGYSMSQIANMRLRRWEWTYRSQGAKGKAALQVKYYGGDCTLYEDYVINEVFDYLYEQERQDV